jgi:hypothetical protein
MGGLDEKNCLGGFGFIPELMFLEPPERCG